MNQRLGFNTCGVYSGVARDDTLLLLAGVCRRQQVQRVHPARESASFLASGFFFSTGQLDNGQHEKIVEHLRAVYESSFSTRPLVAPSSRVLQSVFSNFPLMQCTLSRVASGCQLEFFFLLGLAKAHSTRWDSTFSTLFNF